MTYPNTRHLVVDNDGFALITVLWAGTLLSLVALGVVAAVRLEAGAASNAIDRVRSEAIAEAAINRAVLSLLDPREEMRWPTNGLFKDFVFDDVTVRVTIQDERGKININLASDQLLAAMFKAVGVTDDEARALADRVADWRDPDDLRRLSGAEERDYVRAGWQYLPRDRPFETTREVARVLGMTTDTMQQIEPVITVYSNSGSVDLKVAAPAVLQLMLDDPSDGVEEKAGPGRSNRPSPLSMPINPTTAGERAYTIRAVVTSRANAKRAWESVVRLTGNPRLPIWMLNWREQQSVDDAIERQ